MPVGFYYRSFYTPKGIWEKLWKPIVRAKTGASVLPVEEIPKIGGALAYARMQGADLPEQVLTHPGIEVWTDAVCNLWYADNWLAVIRGVRLRKLRAGQVGGRISYDDDSALFTLSGQYPDVLLAESVEGVLEGPCQCAGADFVL